MERGGGEGAFAGEKETAGFGTEEVREVGCGEAESGLACGRACAQTWKRVSCLAGKVTVQSFLWERTLRALEGGGGGRDGG